jgi:hypothetical protein
MTIDIKNNKRLNELQHDFNEAYPYLKLEFFRPANGSSKPGSPMKKLDATLTCKDAGNGTEGTVETDPGITVANFEQVFVDRFGMIVQVFRKSGNIWLETTMTDTWTLYQQNESGREISNPPAPRRIPEEDLDLMRGED